MNNSKILIVDDSIIDRLTLKNLFEDKFEVLEASNVEDALYLLTQNYEQIILIITDIIMPINDGFDFLKAIKENQDYVDIPVIMMSHNNNEDIEIRALALGVDDFITKPYNPDIVHARVVNVLSKAFVFSQKLDDKINNSNKRNTFNLHHDFLTGLLNRESFFEETSLLLQNNPDEKYLILSWNINKFQLVNEYFGKSISDNILISMADCFENIIGNKGTCSRFESDHFVMCIPKNLILINEFLALVQKSLSTFQNNYDILLGVGVYEINDLSLNVSQMCSRSDMALEATRGQYVANIAYYDEKFRQVIVEKQSIESEMNDALNSGQFFIVLQPVFSVSENKPISAEALVRWRHPTKGIISPGKFIPIFEENGFISKLDYYVWEEVCKFLKYSKDNGLPIMPISVNVSRINFYNTNLCNTLLDLVHKYNIEMGLLRLEITESVYTNNPYQVNRCIEQLKRAGFIILMDDFGSGFSSLNMLKDLPVDILKIDMNFIREIESSEKAKSILSNIIRLSKWLEMAPIAEGVETEEQVNYLQSIGCDRIQGYFFSRPLFIEDYTKLILSYKNVINHYKKKSYVRSEDDLKILREYTNSTNWIINEIIGPMGIYEYNENGLEVIQVNDKYFELTKSSSKSMFVDNKNVTSWVHEDDRELVISKCLEVLNTGNVVSFVYRRYCQDSTLIWVKVFLRRLVAKDTSNLFCASFTDISEIMMDREDELVTKYILPLKEIFTDIFLLDNIKHTIIPIQVKSKIDYQEHGTITYEQFFKNVYKRVFISDTKDDHNIIMTNLNKIFNTSNASVSFNVSANLIDKSIHKLFVSMIKCDNIYQRQLALCCIRDEKEIHTIQNTNSVFSDINSFLQNNIENNKIIIIDDSIINRKILKKILGQKYIIFEAENGKEGLNIINKNPDISAILLDIEMPIMNGKEFLKVRKTDINIAKIPVMVITQNDNKEEESNCIQLGASDFLKKPYDQDLIIHKVSYIINQKESKEDRNAVMNFLNNLPGGVAVIKLQEGVKLIYCNERMSDVTGFNFDELIDCFNNKSILFEDFSKVEEAVRKANRREESFDVSFKARFKDGRIHIIRCLGSYAYKVNGFSIYYLIVINSGDEE